MPRRWRRLELVKTTLILGGTGKTGRRIAHRLPEARVASRSSGFDLDDPGTWDLDGIEAAYLVEPDPGNPRLARFVEAAKGIPRVVVLTAPGAGNDWHPLNAAEDAVRNLSPQWTIIRPYWFAQNFSESMWRPGIEAGALELPVGEGRTAFIDADDIADVAVAALTDERHHGQTYTLTGPRSLSFGEAVELIAKATGRSIRFVDAGPDVRGGLYTAIRDGHADVVTGDVERALGRPATPFETYVEKTWLLPR
jgi:uncharacterized protein YbjT (DUF2867 family)